MGKPVEIEEQYRQFAAVVRDKRRQAELKQTELAQITGLTRSTVANIESGRQRVLLAEALKISKALNFSLDNLPLNSNEMPLIQIEKESSTKLTPTIQVLLKKFFTEAARKSAGESDENKT